VKKTIYILLGVLPLFFLTMCSSGTTQKTKTEPAEVDSNSETVKPKNAYKDSFFEVTRFIMTDEEKDIYKHLQDKEAREEFVEEFWKKRDPTPGTEENENREEYEDRIIFANKWFKEHSRNRGWDTDRGRLLLQLGFPDRREWGEAEDIVRSGNARDIGAMISSKPIPMEIWTYYEYRMVLVFADLYEKGRMELTKIPLELPTALEKAKFALDLRNKKKLKHAFRFSAKYKSNGFEITVPVKKVSFEEKGNEMVADFDVNIYIYKDKKKIDSLHARKTFKMEKEKLLTQKNINLKVPFTTPEKGKYYFDIVIEEKGSSSKFRDFVEHKF